jgi:hypothetical protein
MRNYLVFFAVALLGVSVVMPALADEATKSETGNATWVRDVYASAFNPSTGQNSGNAGADSVAPQPSQGSVYSPFVDFQAKYDAWLAMVHRTHEEEQPDWMTPVLTVTPTLQQEIRTDYSLLSAAKHLDTNTYVSKGTEIIPTENTEFIFGNPTWVTKDLPGNKQASGWSDWTFLYKYRLLSSPSNAGNYVVTLMLSTSFDTGSRNITAGHDVITPLVGFGKGFKTQYGEFDYQGTIGPSIPGSRVSTLGTPVTWNSAFQYGNRLNIGGYTLPCWPELEATWTYYPSGEHNGQNQVYLAPGLIFGRFKLSEHTYFVVGAAYQFAATSDKEAAYNHQWLVTMRIPFF